MTIRFATKRGRPRQNFESENPKNDHGTNEFIIKRSIGATKEPIDLLMEYRFISEYEHRAALHFRWLYTLRYGVQNLTSSTFVDIATSHTSRPAAKDSDWRITREEEFRTLATKLRNAKLYDLLCDILIHNVWPLALRREHLRRLSNTVPQPHPADDTIPRIKEAVQLIGKKPGRFPTPRR